MTTPPRDDEPDDRAPVVRPRVPMTISSIILDAEPFTDQRPAPGVRRCRASAWCGRDEHPKAVLEARTAVWKDRARLPVVTEV
jgi:hypothetical protein